MPARATFPTPSRASLWCQRRRRLEPWLFGLCGFSLTAAAMLLGQDSLLGQSISSVLEQIGAVAAK